MRVVSAGPGQIAEAMPRPATGPAVDPVTLEPVDEVVITTVVDNVYDALVSGDERVTLTPFTAGTAREFVLRNRDGSQTGSQSAGSPGAHGRVGLLS